MLLKGQIIGYNGNKYDVRIPSFETAGNPEKYIVTAILAYQPGSEKGLLMGDIVILGFENNSPGSPVILGKLYRGDNDMTAAGRFSSLAVSGSTRLSNDFEVGDISYNDLRTSIVHIAENSKRIDNLEEAGSAIEITAYDPTLAWSTESLVATINDVDIKVTLPPNPGGGGGDIDVASYATLGVVKLGSDDIVSPSDVRVYPVQFDASARMHVKVPWVNANDNISLLYSSSHAYTVGDYCINDDILYCCISPITAGSDFNPDNWTTTHVMDEIKSKQAASSVLSSIANQTGQTGLLKLTGGTASIDTSTYLTSVSWSDVLNKPNFAAVAISGSYNDLTDKPETPVDTNQKVKTATATFGDDDVVEIKAGSNVTVAGNALNKTITISATDTTYSSKAAVRGGEEVSLVTTGEKYTWNAKQDAIDPLFVSGLKIAEDGVDLYVPVDNVLSDSSTYPVQNKVIKSKFNSIDTAITSLSSDLNGKQNKLIYFGETSTNIGQDSTVTSVQIGDHSIDCTGGEIVLHNEAYYVFNGSNWQTLADISNYAKEESLNDYIPLNGTTALNGNIVPKTDNSIALGSPTKQFSHVYSHSFDAVSDGLPIVRRTTSYQLDSIKITTLGNTVTLTLPLTTGVFPVVENVESAALTQNTILLGDGGVKIKPSGCYFLPSTRMWDSDDISIPTTALIDTVKQDKLVYVGDTSTSIGQGSTTSTIVVRDSDVHCTGGEIARYEDTYFVFNKSSWQILADLSGKQNKITQSNKLDYSLLANTPTIPEYTDEPAAQGGSTLSLVTTGDKYIWNHMQRPLEYFGETETEISQNSDTRSIRVNSTILVCNGGEMAKYQDTYFVFNGSTWQTVAQVDVPTGDYIPLAGTTALTGSIVPSQHKAVDLGSNSKAYSHVYSNSFAAIGTTPSTTSRMTAYSTDQIVTGVVGNLNTIAIPQVTGTMALVDDPTNHPLSSGTIIIGDSTVKIKTSSTYISKSTNTWSSDDTHIPTIAAIDAKKQDKITSTNKLDYDLLDNTPEIPIYFYESQGQTFGSCYSIDSPDESCSIQIGESGFTVDEGSPISGTASNIFRVDSSGMEWRYEGDRIFEVSSSILKWKGANIIPSALFSSGIKISEGSVELYVPVDDTFSATSSNPVKNSVLKSKLDTIETSISNYVPLAGTSQLSGDITPAQDNSISLGSLSKKFSSIISDHFVAVDGTSIQDRDTTTYGLDGITFNHKKSSHTLTLPKITGTIPVVEDAETDPLTMNKILLGDGDVLIKASSCSLLFSTTTWSSDNTSIPTTAAIDAKKQDIIDSNHKLDYDLLENTPDIPIYFYQSSGQTFGTCYTINAPDNSHSMQIGEAGFTVDTGIPGSDNRNIFNVSAGALEWWDGTNRIFAVTPSSLLWNGTAIIPAAAFSSGVQISSGSVDLYVPVDSSLSDSSTYPVQNKVVKSKFNSIDTALSALSRDISGKQQTLIYFGETTTSIGQDSTVTSIQIDGHSITCTGGEMVKYQDAYFVFNGANWQTLADMSTKQDKITSSNKLSYSLLKDTPTIPSYENKPAASGGTDLSLVTTGDKYNWNHPQKDINYLGETTTQLGQGVTTDLIVVRDDPIQCTGGEIAFYQGSYYIFNGTTWETLAIIPAAIPLSGTSALSGNIIPASTASVSLGSSSIDFLSIYSRSFTATKSTSGHTTKTGYTAGSINIDHDSTVTKLTLPRLTGTLTVAEPNTVLTNNMLLVGGGTMKIKPSGAYVLSSGSAWASNDSSIPTTAAIDAVKQNIIDNNHKLSYALISGTPNFAAVATSGDYNDLDNTPSNESAVAQGTTLSLVTTGEKYIWNNMIPLTGTSNLQGDIQPITTSVYNLGTSDYRFSNIYSDNFIAKKDAISTTFNAEKISKTVSAMGVTFTYEYTFPTRSGSFVVTSDTGASSNKILLSAGATTTIKASGISIKTSSDNWSVSDDASVPTIKAIVNNMQTKISASNKIPYTYISNAPSLAAVATSGSYNDLTDKPTIPAAQIQADWNQTTVSALDYIKNKPTSRSAAQGGTDISFVTTGEKYTWNNKQDTLVSGTNIKTINNASLLGNGNITISGSGLVVETMLASSANLATIFDTFVRGYFTLVDVKNDKHNIFLEKEAETSFSQSDSSAYFDTGSAWKKTVTYTFTDVAAGIDDITISASARTMGVTTEIQSPSLSGTTLTVDVIYSTTTTPTDNRVTCKIEYGPYVACYINSSNEKTHVDASKTITVIHF